MSERYLDFDTVVNRRGTKCLKYDFAENMGYPKDVLPLWIADMDFKASSYIEDALKRAVSHNIYGYTQIQEGDGFFEALAGWLKRHHAFAVRQEWHVHTPGVCAAIAIAVRAFAKEGEAVLVQQPVYYPFSNIVRQNHRRLVSSDLVYDGKGHYTIDFEDFEKQLIAHDVKLFILCNPHNPVGRVWTKEELERLGNICRKHHVLVFSDEIHFDFVWSGVHHVFQEVDASFREFAITATAPSKTFNIAGVQQSNLFISNQELKQKFEEEYQISGFGVPNALGIVASQAAYTYGEEWYEAVTAYLRENISFAKEFVETQLEGVRLIPTEGTYLLWLDFKETGMGAEALDSMMIHKAKLWLDSGSIFGKTGEGFQRINAACPRSVLKEALLRIKACLEERSWTNS